MITVKRESDLEIQTWTFWYHDREHELRLCDWKLETRDSKRKKFRTRSSWDQMYRYENKPIAPPDVLAEARRQFIETLRVE